MPFISVLRGCSKRESEEVEEIGARREDHTMSVPTITFSKCTFHTQYASPAGSADQCLQRVVQYKVVDKIAAVYFPRASLCFRL